MADKGEKTPRRITRRQFLELVAATAGGAALGYAAWRTGISVPETASSPEKELKPTVLVLDFFDLDKVKIPGFSEEEALKSMGVEDTSTKEGLIKAVPKSEDEAKLLMLLFFKHQYHNHGDSVVDVMQKTADYLGSRDDNRVTNQSSVASAIELEKVEFDGIGNPTMHVRLSPEVVDNQVSQSSDSLVNMSFELGDFSLTYRLYEERLKYPEMARQGPSTITVGEHTTYRDYQGNDITQEEYEEISGKMDETEIVLLDPKERDAIFLDGYASEKAFDNLKMLTDLARKHPEKMFVAAGGNPTYLNGLKVPDIREARKKLEEQGQWPVNLLTVGFTANPGVGGRSEVNTSYGHDLYVSTTDLKSLGFSGASSHATPVITEINRQEIAQGQNTFSKVKASLMKLTEIKGYWSGSEKTEYRVLNLDKAKAALRNPGE